MYKTLPSYIIILLLFSIYIYTHNIFSRVPSSIKHRYKSSGSIMDNYNNKSSVYIYSQICIGVFNSLSTYGWRHNHYISQYFSCRCCLCSKMGSTICISKINSGGSWFYKRIRILFTSLHITRTTLFYNVLMILRFNPKLASEIQNGWSKMAVVFLKGFGFVWKVVFCFWGRLKSFWEVL